VPKCRVGLYPSFSGSMPSPFDSVPMCGEGVIHAPNGGTGWEAHHRPVDPRGRHQPFFGAVGEGTACVNERLSQIAVSVPR